jgi:hypothetical protein
LKDEIRIEFFDYVSFLHKSELSKLLTPDHTSQIISLKNFSRENCHIDVYEMILLKKEGLENQQKTVKII